MRAGTDTWSQSFRETPEPEDIEAVLFRENCRSNGSGRQPSARRRARRACCHGPLLPRCRGARRGRGRRGPSGRAAVLAGRCAHRAGHCAQPAGGSATAGAGSAGACGRGRCGRAAWRRAASGAVLPGGSARAAAPRGEWFVGGRGLPHSLSKAQGRACTPTHACPRPFGLHAGRSTRHSGAAGCDSHPRHVRSEPHGHLRRSKRRGRGQAGAAALAADALAHGDARHAHGVAAAGGSTRRGGQLQQLWHGHACRQRGPFCPAAAAATGGGRCRAHAPQLCHQLLYTTSCECGRC